MTSDLIARIKAAQPGEARGMLTDAAFEIANGNWSMDQVMRFNHLIDAEAYLDAAMMLVPEGWTTDVRRYPGRGEANASLTKWETGRTVSVNGASTPALALAAASLKAKDASDDMDA